MTESVNYRIYSIAFVWNQQKAVRNFEKHGISFEEAATAFFDEDSVEFDDEKHSQLESRFKRLGISSKHRILHVVYTVRSIKDEKETIRIISARQASRKERQVYSRF